jgi:putative pyruvate formate lyase activating enzyme
MDIAAIVERIIFFLNTEIGTLGFVSPTHFTPHVRSIIQALHEKGYFPVTVYNTNAFDSVLELKKLEGLIDVYLPDFKYFDPSIAQLYSDSGSYPDAAKAALREMFRQKGSTLILDNDGQVVTGMIIRHLVLPGYSDDSIHILRWIAEELSVSVHLSLMSQYFPTSGVQFDPIIDRPITASEYKTVTDTMEELGFCNGWVQELNSPVSYQPDFNKENPFSMNYETG